MDMRMVADELVRVAKLLEGAPNQWVTAEEMESICPSCAEKMRSKGMKSVRATALPPNVRKQAAKWETLPEGWNRKSLEQYWNTMTGKVKNRVTKCIKEMTGHVSDPGAFCSSLADRLEGTGWRSER